MAFEWFGNSRHGDFAPPPGSVIRLTEDMHWRDLIIAPGGITTIYPQGNRIFVSRTLRGPSTTFGPDGLVIDASGADADTFVGASGHLPRGTIGGGAQAGGTGLFGDGSPLDASALLWPAAALERPGVGGTGGHGAGSIGGVSTPPTPAAASAGSMGQLESIVMRLVGIGTDPIFGATGGGGGGGDGGSNRGGGGGAGAENMVLCARAIENATSVVVSSRGGGGAQPSGINAGGGGGGGGGLVACVVFDLPYPIIAVDGGDGGPPLGGTGTSGANGQPGHVLRFKFVVG